MRTHRMILLTLLVLLLGFALVSPTNAATEVRFLFPVQTAGALAIAMEEVVAQFNDQNPDIRVNPIFTGNYAVTNDRIRTSTLAGNPPHVALTDISQPPVLLELDAVVDLTPYIDAQGSAFHKDFISGFWRNFEMDDKVLGLPFQHSIPLMYYNKEAFVEAGLDPEQPPMTWAETKAYAEALMAANPTQLPLVSPGGSWILQGFVDSNSTTFAHALNSPNFDDPLVIEALEFVYDMIHTWDLMAIRGWGESSEDLLAGDAAMMYNSTGSMGFVRGNAYFPWGVAPIPRNDGHAHAFPYGGGGLFLFKGHSQAEEQAAWEFMKFLTSPEITAHWSIATGYFAVRHSAYERPEMLAYLEEFPQAKAASDLLQYTNAQWVMHRHGEVSQLVANALEAVEVLGSKSPEEAMLELQPQLLELFQ